MNKLTENEVVECMIQYLKVNGWEILEHHLGMEHGCDIIASNKGRTMIIEAKGARANNNAPNKKRKYFDSTQIKTHFGKAVVKVLEEKVKNNTAIFGIAQPYDNDILKNIGSITKFLEDLGIKHFWVYNNGEVKEAY